ncbi:hypothetical protein [uncultured Tateyamaria sp.]|uniref:hypothetical protein n=1 Tax=uncultured Tateyamaria sp. TaxID=455651 RepID=UPI0026307AC4|nr:hypothetical protein [uncultured Tateyamaria sp.]
MLACDEARRDLVLFDCGHPAADDEIAKRARLAGEIAWSWIIKPEHVKALAIACGNTAIPQNRRAKHKPTSALKSHFVRDF